MIVYLIGSMVTFPIFPTLLVYLITYKMTDHKFKAIHNAVNWTTLLYIVATIHLSYIIFGYYFVSFIVGLLLFILIITMIIQWQMKTEVVFSKAFKISWRVYFLLFFILYIILSLIGILQRIIYY